MKLISLEEHNRAIQQSVHDPVCGEARPNGIKCPNGSCKGELLDLNPNMILTSMPPQKTIICRKCGWKGTRLA